jgi:hypothetical protein
MDHDSAKSLSDERLSARRNRRSSGISEGGLSPKSHEADVVFTRSLVSYENENDQISEEG